MSAFIAAQSNSKEIETVQMSVNRRMGKANVPHTHTQDLSQYLFL